MFRLPNNHKADLRSAVVLLRRTARHNPCTPVGLALYSVHSRLLQSWTKLSATSRYEASIESILNTEDTRTIAIPFAAL